MHANGRPKWRAVFTSLATLLSVGVLALTPASPTYADAPCRPGGVYMIWARGSGQKIGAPEVKQFQQRMAYELGLLGMTRYEWAELGNLDGTVGDSEDPDESHEYPAIGFPWFPPFSSGLYSESVRKGTDELVKHLNIRTASCPQETVVLAGYSQGADVVGWALERLGGPDWALTTEARRHIGFAALYGDPKFEGDDWQARTTGTKSWWVRGDDPGWDFSNGQFYSHDGFLGARSPYARGDLWGRLGSWCDNDDGLCTGTMLRTGSQGNHGTAYQQSVVHDSAPEIARAALGKFVELNPWLGDWNHDGQPDFFAFNKQDGGSGKTVYFVLNGHSPGQMLQVGATPFGWTDDNWSFAPGYDFNRDGTPELYAFNKRGANGKTDYAVLNGRLPDGPPVQSGATAFGWVGANVSFMPGPDWNRDGIPDLYAFDRQDTGSGKTVYFVMDGRNPTQFLQIGATAFGWTDANWSFAPGQDWNGDGMWDFYAFNKRDAGSGRTVYFVLNGRDPSQFLQIGMTAFGWTGDNYLFMPGPDWNHDGRPDLYAFDKRDGGSGHTVYFVMDGRDPARFLQVGTLPFGWTDNNWQFGVFNG